jgi:subtilase family serine protease
MRPTRSALLPSCNFSTVIFAAPILGIILVSSALIGPMAQAQSRPILITQAVDESKLVTLAGNTRPEANKQNDRGLVPDSLSLEHVMLQLKRSPAQEWALLQYIEELQLRTSPDYHRWLTAKQFGQRFGLATQDLNVITSWLESHGLKVNVVYTNGLLIDFSGTAGQVQSAFHTEIHQLDVKGEKHFANVSDPRIPAALAPAVVGVVALHDFKPHTNYKLRSNYTVGGGEYLVVPGDLATIYNLNPLFTAGTSGQGQTIVVVEDSDVYSTADWTTFRSVFGLSSFTGGSFTQVHPAPPSGTNNCTDPGINSDDGEAILDAEYASAAAPSATIELASCNDTATFGGLIAIQNLLNKSSTPPAIMSVSYGDCEADNGATANAAFNSTFQQAVTEGVSVFVSSGDEGAASCSINTNESSDTYGIGVSGWASTPYNVAVGGTDFGDTFAGTNSTYWSATNSPTYESALSYIPEIPWNDSCGSLLGAQFEGFTQTYGTSGFCNSSIGEGNLTTAAGSGGPSGCATGSPSTQYVVSGTCAGRAKPTWQSLVGNPSDAVRDLPDVSLFAGNGIWGHYYPFCYSDPSAGNGGAPCTGTPNTWSGAGGTSFSSPIMAGIQALVNQKTGERQGNPNPVYYDLAAAEYGASGDSSCNSTLGNTTGSSCIFYDVTQGDMDVNCLETVNCYLPSGTNGVLSTSDGSYEPAYGTATGWDFATGVGSVNAYNLVHAWPGTETPGFTLSAAPTSVAITPGGAGGTSTITVADVGGFTGSVALAASGLPSGVTASFNPTSTTGMSTLTLTASGSAAAGGPTTVTITGISGSLTATTTVALTVSQNFTVPPTLSTPASAEAGQSTSTTMALAPVGGGSFTSNVTYACTSGLPTGATCSFNPTQIGSGGSAQSVTITVQTAGPFTGAAGGVKRGEATRKLISQKQQLWLPLSLPLAGIVMVGLFGGGLPRRYKIVGLCLTLTITGFLVACGGGSSSTPPPPSVVTVSPSSVSTLYPNLTGFPAQTQQFSANVSNSTSQTVTWAVTGGSGNGSIDQTGLYTAPATLPSPANVRVTATSATTTTPGTATVNLQTPTPTGQFPVTVTVTEGGIQHTTTFTLKVTD